MWRFAPRRKLQVSWANQCAMTHIIRFENEGVRVVAITMNRPGRECARNEFDEAV